MPPALAPVPPDIFKRMLELDGFQVGYESGDYWILVKEDALRPQIVISKEGDVMSIGVMENILHQLQMDNKKFFDLKEKACH